MNHRGRIVVVGAGPVGCVLSVLLARLGFAVELFERRAADHREARESVNLTLCARGFAALRAVGADAWVRDHCVEVSGRMLHAADGSAVFTPYGEAGESLASLSRAALSRALFGFASAEPGVQIRTGERCVDVDLDAPAVLFENVSTGVMSRVRADTVFGADGAFSAVRLRLQKTDRFSYSQDYFEQGYRELVLPGDGTVPRLDPRALHFWPRDGVYLVALPNVDGSFTLSLGLPFEGPRSFAALRTPGDVRTLFEAEFPDLLALAPQLIDAYFDHPPNSLVTIRCSSWVLDDRIALVGDAAHAIVPYYGQGVNAGFEDCLTLADCIAEHGDMRAALAAYQDVRKPDTEIMAMLAQRHFFVLRDQLVTPAFALRRKLEQRLHRLFPGRFVPLYDMIVFSRMRYSEAWAREQRHAALLDALLARPEVVGLLGADAPRLDDLLRAAVAS